MAQLLVVRLRAYADIPNYSRILGTSYFGGSLFGGFWLVSRVLFIVGLLAFSVEWVFDFVGIEERVLVCKGMFSHYRHFTFRIGGDDIFPSFTEMRITQPNKIR